ncbi:probable serine/threonine-protein kinase DDB_G0282963 [Leptopilina heterotoma]|uniref:probable serine/threonine-protein kinase DDB_G0282963 n=1 Tax=Leptopilina heterotoma TaxID=63436 RepID=UPI001CA9066A|nr:probable serine/threonine-protein kinase DDB_G0282963 [Leptopilina heterotoma]
MKRNTREESSSMDNNLEKPRRSSLQVNLSYLTNSPDSFEELLNDFSSTINKPIRRTSLNLEKPQRNLPRIISIETRGNNSETFSKDKLLNENCSQLRSEILRKTKELYQNNSELMEKTQQVLQEKKSNKKLENFNSDSEFKKSPSIKIVLKEDEQLTMSATKNTENLLSVKIMKSPLTTRKMETPKSSRCLQITSKLSKGGEENNLPRKRLFAGLGNLSTSPILSGATSKKRAKHASNLERLKNNSLKCSSINENCDDDQRPNDSMEMTTISSHLPIGTRNSFEETGKCSQDKRIISMELTEIKGKILSTPWKNGENNSNSNDSLTNRTSLNVNTSLDRTSQLLDIKNGKNKNSRKSTTSFEGKNGNENENESFETAKNDDQEEKNSSLGETENSPLNETEKNENGNNRENCEESEKKLIGKRVRNFSLSLNGRELGKRTRIEEERTGSKIVNNEGENSQTSPKGSKIERPENVISKRKKLFNLDSKLEKSVVILERNNESFEGGEDFLKPRTSERRKMRSSVIEIGETSRVEVTPYPVSRSFMWKSQIKQNTIGSHSNGSLDKSVSSIDEEATGKRRKNSKEKHPALDSSESDTESQKRNTSRESARRRRISETSSKSSLKNNDTLNESTTSTSSALSSKMKKKKLYPLRGHSGLLTMSPMNTPTPKAKVIKKHRKNVKWQKMKETQRTQRLERTQLKNTDTDESNTEDLEEEIVEVPKKPKRTRKIVSKKIIFKKKLPIDNNEEKLIDKGKRRGRNLIKNCEFSESRRSSMTDFELVEEKEQRKKSSKRVHIVTTGFSNGDKSKVKNVVKELGKAEIESNVTRKTTHVISTGVRTINLLKGILRGCWLVSLEWVLKSQTAGKWINPEPFELAHFSESVKENRRERQIFGNAYVPELFLNCGLIHVNGGTNPSPPILKDLIKLAGGQITENPKEAKIKIGSNGLREIWILDSITSGKIQPEKQYRQRT